MDTTSDRIKTIIEGSDIVLFMKGQPSAPQCGFSAAVVNVLSAMAIPYASIDVLADNEIREGIKAYSNWPTIPQLYVKGEFVGGADIVREMFKSGELAALLGDKGVAGPA
jgi:monothiol glutaredoxin